MPYCSAVVLETLRYSTIVSLSVLHTNTSETRLFGYRLPKGTIIAANLWAVHFDPKYWGDPEVFRPERFLDENGMIKKPDYLIPFATGKRVFLNICFRFRWYISKSTSPTLVAECSSTQCRIFFCYRLPTCNCHHKLFLFVFQVGVSVWASH